MQDGLVKDIYWPEMEYLVRVAGEVPSDVVDVLLGFKNSNNDWVKRGTFKIGVAVPSEQAILLRPLIESWLPTGLGSRTDPRDLVSFAVNLLGGSSPKVGRWFANVLFRPSLEKSGGGVSKVLDDFWYGEELPRLVDALGSDGLKVVLPWLIDFERQIGRITDDSDYSYLNRDSIRYRGDASDCVEHALIDAVRDLSIQKMQSDLLVAVALLLGSGMRLGRKIALFALTEALGGTKDDETRVLMIKTAKELLFDETSAADFCRIEFAELARAVACATGEPLEPLVSFIRQGPRVDDSQLREWLDQEGLDSSELDERVTEYILHWKHRWLAALGLDTLPQPLRDDLVQLDARCGAIENPLEPEVSNLIWVGPTSPLDLDEMTTMTANELVAHLESWRAGEGGCGPSPSHEGQERVLSSLLTTNPNALGEVTRIVERLRPTYVRAILTGWEAALKSGLKLDWNQVVQTVSDVMLHPAESVFKPESQGLEDDPDMRLCKRAAVGLVEEAVRKQHAPMVPGDAMKRLVDLLIKTSNDERAWEDYAAHGGSPGMDPMTTSLNWQWPVRLRGLTHLMAWGSEASWYIAACHEVERELERHDPWGASRAVMGESLGRLVDASPDWITSKAHELFGAGDHLSTLQQITLSSAMVAYRYHPVLYELLSPAMVAAVKSDEKITPGWDAPSDPLQRIGEWVIEAIIRGDETTVGPVARAFFSTAPAEVRGAALGRIGWTFMHASTVDDPIRDRLAELWDERVACVRSHAGSEAELKGFYWFVLSHKFAIEWWLPRLHEALKLCPELGLKRFLIGKEIASSADCDPRMAFDVLKLILKVSDENGMVNHDLTQHAIPIVLGRAITSEDDELRQEAESYMNQLGEAGIRTLEDEVRAVIDGDITQNDVGE